MVRWICPECGREWAQHEPCCWVCEQYDPPMGGLCRLDPPPVINEAAHVVAYGGMPVLNRRQRSPVFADYVFEIDREEWRSLEALSRATSAGASELPAPAIEITAEPDPDPESAAHDIQYEALPLYSVAPAEEVVTALIPDDSPPRIIPNWVVSMVLVLALIAGLSLLVYLVFHANLFSHQEGERKTASSLVLPGSR